MESGEGLDVKPRLASQERGQVGATLEDLGYASRLGRVVGFGRTVPGVVEDAPRSGWGTPSGRQKLSASLTDVALSGADFTVEDYRAWLREFGTEHVNHVLKINNGVNLRAIQEELTAEFQR